MTPLRIPRALFMIALLVPHWASGAMIELEPIFTLGRPGGLAGSASGWFDVPCEVSTDASGRIYVGENNNHRMQVFDANGTYLYRVTQQSINADGSLSRGNFVPIGIAAAADGTVFVADQGNSMVQVLSSQGRWLRGFGSSGASGGLTLPTSIALIGGRVYVSDFATSSVHSFDLATGGFLGTFGASATTYRFWSPSGLSSDASGRIFISDSENGRIHYGVPGAGPRSLSSFGTPGVGRGQLNSPRDIAVAGNGLRYVINSSAEGRIEVYSPNDTHVATILGDTSGQLLVSPTAIHVDGDRLFLTDDVRHRLQVFRILLPELRISNVGTGEVTEDSGGVVEFQVTRSGSPEIPLSVPIAVSGTATAGVDYQSAAIAAGSITIPAGSNSATIQIAIAADNLDEEAEDIGVTLSPGALYRLAPGATTARLTINDDDFAPVTVEGEGFEVAENGTMTVERADGVLAGATDADDGPAALTAELASDVSHGVLELSADGSFSYRPSRGYHGPDEFFFRGTDGSNFSALTRVRIEVIQQVDLQLQGEASAAPFLAGSGEAAWHRYTVTNAGPSTATGIRLSVAWVLPAGASTGTPGTSRGSFEGSTWSIPELLPGEAGQLLLPFIIPASTSGGEGILSSETEVVEVAEPLILTDDDRARQASSILSPASITLSGLNVSPLLDRQSGLLNHRISVVNGNANPVGPFRLVVLGLPAGVMPRGASGMTADGYPYFLINPDPVAAGASLELRIEYFSPTRSGAFTPVYRIELLRSITPPTAADGLRFAIDRGVSLADGSFLIEWTSVPGARYAVEYSPDLGGWLQAGEGITAAANRSQWIDSGPPKTPLHPSAAGVRYYRVVRLDTDAP